MDVTNKEILVLVKNNPGILNKISSLFAKRGINIDTIAIGSSLPNDYVRITISGVWDDYTTKQIIVQANKFFDVIFAKELLPETTIIREIAFLKIKLTPDTTSKIINLAVDRNGKILEMTTESIILEFVGSTIKVSETISLFSAFEILEISRTSAMMSMGPNL